MEQKLNSTGPVNTANTSKGNSANEGGSWVKEYYDAARAGFLRVWLNKYLWFWGIFLPAGFGFNANYNLNSQDFSKNGKIEKFAQNFSGEMEGTLSDFAPWIILGVLLLLVIFILLWLISAVARSGVIQAMDALQNPTAGSIHTFKTVWQNGKGRFLQVMMIDVAVGFSMFLILVILATPIVLLVVQSRFAGAAILGILAFLIYLPLVFLSMFLRQSAVIITVLAMTPAISSIERAYLYVWGNLRESFKLLLSLMVMGFVQGLAAFIALIPVAIVVVGVVLLFVGFSGGSIASDPSKRTVSIVVISIVIVFLLAVFMLIKSIFSLWIQDVWVWWTKKVGSAMSQDVGEDGEKVKVEQAVKSKALGEIKGS